MGCSKKLGAAQDRAGRVATGLVHAEVSAEGRLSYQLDRAALRAVRQRGRPVSAAHDMTARRSRPDLALLYGNCATSKKAFRTLKGDLGLRPHLSSKTRAHRKHTCSSPFSLTAS